MTDAELTEMAHRVPPMPIETAPRNGRRILGYDRFGWREMWFVQDQYEGDFWQDEGDSEPNPSHWIPVPQTVYATL